MAFTSQRTKPKHLLRTLDHLGLGDELRRICVGHLCKPKQVLKDCRLRHVMAARREFCGELRERGLSYPAIGELVGRDHSTVLAMLRLP